MVTYCVNEACTEYRIDKTIDAELAATDPEIMCGTCNELCVPIENREPVAQEGRTYDTR